MVYDSPSTGFTVELSMTIMLGWLQLVKTACLLHTRLAVHGATAVIHLQELSVSGPMVLQ